MTNLVFMLWHSIKSVEKKNNNCSFKADAQMFVIFELQIFYMYKFCINIIKLIGYYLEYYLGILYISHKLLDFLPLVKALSFWNKADPTSYMMINLSSVPFK